MEIENEIFRISYPSSMPFKKEFKQDLLIEYENEEEIQELRASFILGNFKHL